MNLTFGKFEDEKLCVIETLEEYFKENKVFMEKYWEVLVLIVTLIEQALRWCGKMDENC